MASKFGGIPLEVETEAGSKFGGTPVAVSSSEQKTLPTAQPSPNPRKIALLNEIKKRPSFMEFLEPLLTIGTAAVAEPVAGVAGMVQSVNPWAEEGAGAKAVESTREAMTYQPRGELGQQVLSETGELLEPAGEVLSDVETGLGDFAYDVTGSPAVAAAAASIPTALFELAGLASLKSLRKGTRLKNPDGSPTKALRKNLEKEGITYENLDEVQKASIPEVADPSILPGASPAKEEAKRVLSEHLKSGSTEGGLATKTLDQYGNVVDFTPGKEAIKQGFRPGFVRAVEVSSPETKNMMKKMLDRMRKIQGNERLALDIRPTGIVGDSVMKRVNVIRDKVNQASKDLTRVVKENLPGKTVDTELIYNTLDEALADLDIGFDDAGNLDFSDSIVMFNNPAKKAIKDVVKLLDNPDIDAVKAHKFKRVIDDLIDYNKKGDKGLSDKGENVLKQMRSSLNEAIRTVDPEYADINDVLHKGIDGLDDLQQAVGKKYDLRDPRASEIVGQEMRKLMSNYGKRNELVNSIEKLNEVAQEFGGNFDDDIKTLAMFANGLDERFGAVARTSLKGTMEQSGAKVARAAASPKMAIVDVVAGKAGKGLDKMRGVNDSNAFESLNDVLKYEVNQ